MTNLYDILPSEVGRLMLGFIEERGLTKSAECLLEELPELNETALHRKKGLRVRPRIDGYSLVELLNDFFQTKDIIYENINKYPSTFSSVKKILSLHEQVQIIIDIAINKQTYLDFRKKQPKNFTKAPNHLAVTQSSRISVSVGGHGTASNDSPASDLHEAGQILFIVENSALDDANNINTNSKNGDHLVGSPCGEDRDTSDLLEVSEIDSISPAKRKGSVRKKNFPSPKNKYSVLLDSSQKVILDKLMTDTSLHATLADTINKTLENYQLTYLSPHSNNMLDEDEVSHQPLSSNNNDVCKNNEGSRKLSKSLGLPDNIIRDITMEFSNQLLGQYKAGSEKCNDISSSLLYIPNCDSSEPPLASSHGTLTTPVPQFSPHDNFSLNTSLFNTLQNVDEINCNSQMTNLSFFDQCLKSDFNRNSVQSHGNEPPSIDNTFNLQIPSLPNNTKEINNVMYEGSINDSNNLNNQTSVENVDVKNSENESSSSHKQLPFNVSNDACLARAGGENCLNDSISLHSSVQNIDAFLENKIPQNILGKESEPFILTDNQVVETGDSLTQSEIELRPSTSLPDSQNESSSQIISDSNTILPSLQNEIINVNLNNNDFNQIKPSTTDELLNSVSGAANSHLTSFSPNYLSPAIAIPVNSVQLPNSNYFSGTPDHPCNYTLTELTPLSPTSACESSLQKHSNPICNADNAEKEGNENCNPNALQPHLAELMRVEILENSLEKGSSSIQSTRIHTDIGESVITEIPSLINNQSQCIVAIIPMKSSNPDFPDIVPKIHDRLKPSINIDDVLEDLKNTRQRKKIKKKASTNSVKNKGTNSKNLPETENMQISHISVGNPDKKCIQNIDKFSHMEPLKPRRVKRRRGLKKSQNRAKESDISHGDLLNEALKMCCDAFSSTSEKIKDCFETESVMNEGEVINPIETSCYDAHLDVNISDCDVEDSVQFYSNDKNCDPKVTEDSCLSKASEACSKKIAIIPVPDDMLYLVDQVERGSIEKDFDSSVQKQTDENDINVDNSNCTNNSSLNILNNSKLQSFLTFSKSFTGNVSPSFINPNHKGSFSTPRNKNHIRALDFGTPSPRKAFSSQKFVKGARTSLTFSSPSPIKKFNMKYLQNQSKEFSNRTKRKGLLENIEEESSVNDVTGLCSSIVLSGDKSCSDVVNLSNDLELSEESNCDYENSKNEFRLKDYSPFKSLKTPGKFSTEFPVCLEPSTPFQTTTKLNNPATCVSTINTPAPSLIATPGISSLLKSHPYGPYSESSQETYYCPSERSVSLLESISSHVEEDFIGTRTTQFSGIQFNKSNENEFNDKENVVADNISSNISQLKDSPKAALKQSNNLISCEEVNLITANESGSSNSNKLLNTEISGLNGEKEISISSNCDDKDNFVKKSKMAYNDINVINNQNKPAHCGISSNQDSEIVEIESSISNQSDLYMIENNESSTSEVLKRHALTTNFNRKKNSVKMLSRNDRKKVVSKAKVKRVKAAKVGKKKSMAKPLHASKASSKLSSEFHKKSNRSSSELNLSLLELEIEGKFANYSETIELPIVAIEPINAAVLKRYKVSELPGATMVPQSSREKVCENITENIHSPIIGSLNKDLVHVDVLPETSSSSINSSGRIVPEDSTQIDSQNVPMKAKALPLDAEKDNVMNANINKGVSSSETRIIDNEEEFVEIERQLEALDGKGSNSPNSPELRSQESELNLAEVFTPPIKDALKAIMCTPNKNHQHGTSTTSRHILLFDSSSKSSMMHFTPLPGTTPDKEIEEICKSVVKKKNVLAAFPTTSKALVSDLWNSELRNKIHCESEVSSQSFSDSAKKMKRKSNAIIIDESGFKGFDCALKDKSKSLLLSYVACNHISDTESCSSSSSSSSSSDNFSSPLNSFEKLNNYSLRDKTYNSKNSSVISSNPSSREDKDKQYCSELPLNNAHFEVHSTSNNEQLFLPDVYSNPAVVEEISNVGEESETESDEDISIQLSISLEIDLLSLNLSFPEAYANTNSLSKFHVPENSKDVSSSEGSKASVFRNNCLEAAVDKDHTKATQADGQCKINKEVLNKLFSTIDDPNDKHDKRDNKKKMEEVKKYSDSVDKNRADSRKNDIIEKFSGSSSTGKGENSNDATKFLLSVVTVEKNSLSCLERKPTMKRNILSRKSKTASLMYKMDNTSESDDEVARRSPRKTKSAKVHSTAKPPIQNFNNSALVPKTKKKTSGEELKIMPRNEKRKDKKKDYKLKDIPSNIKTKTPQKTKIKTKNKVGSQSKKISPRTSSVRSKIKNIPISDGKRVAISLRKYHAVSVKGSTSNNVNTTDHNKAEIHTESKRRKENKKRKSISPNGDEVAKTKRIKVDEKQRMAKRRGSIFTTPSKSKFHKDMPNERTRLPETSHPTLSFDHIVAYDDEPDAISIPLTPGKDLFLCSTSVEKNIASESQTTAISTSSKMQVSKDLTENLKKADIQSIVNKLHHQS